MGLALAERVPVGMVHINDQTSTDEAIAPFGGVGSSGNGYRIGGQEANLAGVHGNAMDNGQSGARELSLLIRLLNPLSHKEHA